MLINTRLSIIAKSVTIALLATTNAGIAFSANATTETANVNPGNYYMGPRKTDEITNQDLRGHYINFSKGTPKTLSIKQTQADFVEGGDKDATTKTNITLDDVKLSGVKKDHNYDEHPKGTGLQDKNYALGDSIYFDSADKGSLALSINTSALNGDISAENSGAKDISISSSTITGATRLKGAENHVNFKDTRQKNLANSAKAIVIAEAGNSTITLRKSKFEGGIDVSGKETLLDIGQQSTVAGDITLNNSQHTDIRLTDSGVKNITLTGNGTNQVTLINSDVNHNLDAAKATGNTTVALNHSTVEGNIALGTGKNNVQIANHSEVKGNVNSLGSDSEIHIDNSSILRGDVNNFAHIYAADGSLLDTAVIRNKAVDLTGHSALNAAELNSAQLAMDTESQFAINSALLGINTATVKTFSVATTEGEHALGYWTSNGGGKMQAQFANGSQQVTARKGAWNYDLALHALNKSGSTTEEQLAVKRSTLASDVQGAQANLNAAQRSSKAVTGSVAQRFSKLDEDALFNHRQPGANVWSDYIGQNDSQRGDAGYHGKMQGTMLGMDWTSEISDDSQLTSGLAFGFTRTKVNDRGDGAQFHNRVNGRYYTLYSGWQKNLRDDKLGLFANGNLTWGDMSYSLKAANVTAATDGNKQQLTGGSHGNSYSAELRTGVAIKPLQQLIVQPYVLAGWNKTDAQGFSDKAGQFGHNQRENMYAGAGLRTTAHFKLGSVKLMPWADVNYTTDITDNSRFSAMDYQRSQGQKMQTTALSLGTDIGINENLSTTIKATTRFENHSSDTAMLVGVNYHF